MKETDFIEQNKAKWQEFEKELEHSTRNPDRISHFYIETIDDLSYARTHYPNRLVRSYLNDLAEKLSLEVQKSQKNYLNNFIQFWKQDLPLMMFEARYQFLLSFLILAISIGIGVFSSMHDPTFANYILGDEYIAITLENIEKGDPMAIYKDEAKTDMFLSITINNIMVSVKTFLLSLFAGVGTILIIIYNGVMLGVFQYFFIERGLFAESFLTIWQHGTIEISCIVLAGTAGLVLAKGVLFPGTYSRLNAFRIAGKKSLIIMLGLMPLLVYSGAIEAFLTRYTEIHWSVRLISILITLSFVLIYFVWYPRKVAANTDWKKTFQSYLSPIEYSRFSFNRIEKNSTLIWESLRTVSLYYKKVLWPSVLAILGLVAMFFFSVKSGQSFLLDYDGFFSIYTFFTNHELLIFICNLIFISLAFNLSQKLCIIHAQHKNAQIPSWQSSRLKSVIISFFLAAIFAFCLRYGILFIVVILLLPLAGLFLISTILEGGKINFRKFRKWLSASYGKLLLLTLILFAVTFIANILVQFIFSELLLEFLGNFISTDGNYMVINFLTTFIPTSLLLLTGYLVLFTAYSLSYFGIKESQTAEHLKKRIVSNFPSNDEVLPQHAKLLSNRKLNAI